jgi:O-antigen/teichoic acid export membrane protein
MNSRLAGIVAQLSINRNYANALISGYCLMGVTIIVQIVLVPLYLSHLGKEKFGILAMIMAANSYAAIGVGWLSGGIARILAERAAVDDVEGFKAGYAFAKWLYVGYALLAVAIFWIVAPWLLPNSLKDNEVVWALVLASVYLVLLYEYNADRAAFNARHWQSKGNLREVVGQCVFAAGVLGGFHAGWGLPSVIAAQIAGILTTRFLAWCFWKRDPWNLTWMKSIANFRQLWARVSGKMGREYVAYGVLILTLQADVLILGWLSNPETVANYYILWRIPEVVILLLWRIPGSYGPFLIANDARGEQQAIEMNYKRGLYFMIALSGIAAVIYGILGQYIVTIWVGSDAPDGYIPYLLAAGAMFFLAVAKWPSGIAYSLLNTRPLAKIATIELATKIILILSLFKVFGFLTTIIATLITHGVIVTALYLWLGNSTVKMAHSVGFVRKL